MNKPKKVWLSRDKVATANGDDYVLWTTKPVVNFVFYGFTTSGPRCRCLGSFCADCFELFTGFELEPGKCVRVEIPVKVV